MSHLLSEDQVETLDYYKSWRKGFRLAGFLQISEYQHPLPWQKWELPPYNHFFTIAHRAAIRGVGSAFLLPVFFNDEIDENLLFDTELPGIKDSFEEKVSELVSELNRQYPAVAFFKGNDDWHYALRYRNFEERDEMVKTFGEELGFNHVILIGHN